MLKPLKATSLRSLVFDSLRTAIFSGQLKPGDPLREIHLARDLGVSQSTIREALVQLEYLGLVTRIANKGTTVTRLMPREVQERLDVRRRLEEMAFLAAARNLTDADFAVLNEDLEKMRTVAFEADHFEASQVDQHFHRTVWQASGNEVLTGTLVQLTTPLFAFISIERQMERRTLDQFVGLHEELYDALAGRKASVVRSALRNHLDSFLLRHASDAPAGASEGDPADHRAFD